MSDRYNYPDDSHAPGEDEELLGALLAKHAARSGGHERVNRPPPLVEKLTRMELELERIQAYEEEPLRLTAKQRERMWGILVHEAGPIVAARILKRVEEEA